MNINFIKILLSLSVISSLQEKVSNSKLQESDIKCDKFNEIPNESDCIVKCNDFESPNQNQDCTIVITRINISQIFVSNEIKMDINKIFFEGEHVMNLPLEIYKVIPNVKHFNANTTSIKIVTYQDFKNLKNLTTLTLSNGELTDICGTTFQDLKSLIEIDLSVNEIKFLHPNLFKENSQLQKIDLSSNMLEVLHPMLFSRLPKLSILDLNFNGLVYIEKRQFQNNKMLSELQLIGNNIKVIEIGTFDELRSLNLTFLNNLCTEVNFFDNDDDESNQDINMKISFINKYCGETDDDRDQIEDVINTYNKWFGSKFVADKCGSNDKWDYIPFYLEKSSALMQIANLALIFLSLFSVPCLNLPKL